MGGWGRAGATIQSREHVVDLAVGLLGRLSVLCPCEIARSRTSPLRPGATSPRLMAGARAAATEARRRCAIEVPLDRRFDRCLLGIFDWAVEVEIVALPLVRPFLLVQTQRRLPALLSGALWHRLDVIDRLSGVAAQSHHAQRGHEGDDHQRHAAHDEEPSEVRAHLLPPCLCLIGGIIPIVTRAAPRCDPCG